MKHTAHGVTVRVDRTPKDAIDAARAINPETSLRGIYYIYLGQSHEATVVRHVTNDGSWFEIEGRNVGNHTAPSMLSAFDWVCKQIAGVA